MKKFIKWFLGGSVVLFLVVFLTTGLPMHWFVDQPLQFEQYNLEFPKAWLRFNGGLELTADRAKLSTNGESFELNNIEVTLSKLITARELNANVQLEPFKLSKVVAFLPDNPDATLWLKEKIENSDISNLSLSLSDKLSNVLNNFDPKSVAADLDYADLVLKHAIDETNLAVKIPRGHINLKAGEVTVKADAGEVNTQKVQSLTVKLAEIFNTPELTFVKGNVSGGLNELFGIVAKKVKLQAPREIEGQHSTDIDYQKRGPVFMRDLGVKSSLSTIKADVHDFPLAIDTITIDLKDAALEVHGDASYRGSEVKVDAEGDVTQLPITAKAIVNGTFDFSIFEPEIKNYLILSNYKPTGTIDFKMEGGPAVDFSFAGRPEELKIPSIEYAAENEKLNLKGHVSLLTSDLVINSQDLDLELKAQHAVNPKIEVSHFKTDKINLDSINFQGGAGVKLIVKGESFILSTEKDDAPSEKEENKKGGAIPDNLEVAVDISKLTLNKNQFSDVALELIKKGNILEKLLLKTTFSKEHSFSLEKVEANKIVGKSNDFGSVLKALTASESYKSGKLRLTLSTPNRNELDLQDLVGEIKIKKMSIKDQPLLLQFISYFSIDKWLSPHEGVPFSEISAKGSFKDNLLKLEDIKFDAPYISIHLSELEINFTTSEIKGSGKAIPLRIVGKVAENVPVVGGVISGTQQAVVAVPFGLKGTISEPKLSFIL